jgi:hypothetical protein
MDLLSLALFKPHPASTGRLRRGVAIAAMGLATVLAGCTESSTDLVCTMEFRTLTVQVHDEAGQPVPDAALRVHRSDTDEAWPPVTAGGPVDAGRGTYAVIDDSHLPLIQPSERVPLTLTATRSGPSAAAGTVLWVVTSDGCHVSRVSGPDTLTVTGVSA